MNTIKFLFLITLITTFNSCSNDDGTDQMEVESRSVSNLHAPQEGGQGQPVSGPFTKFDLETGIETTSQTEWDIAFRGTTIIVNGGASFGATDEPARNGEAAVYIASGTLASVNQVDTTAFEQDSAAGYAISSGSNNGWYTYAGPPTHLISPIAGKILVFRTRSGNFAKMEILSYYENAPENPDAFVDADGYYTFNFVYQPNNGEVNF